MKHVEKFMDDIIQRHCCLIMDGIQANHHWHRPCEDDSDDSPAPTVIANTDIGNPSELAIGLDSLPPFAEFGTVASKQEDVAEASGSSLAAPAATSSSAMPAATTVAAAASSSFSALLAASASLATPTAATVALASDAHGSWIKEPPVRQRTELSEALSVASATDAHGSLIEEPQVRKRSKLSEARSACIVTHLCPAIDRGEGWFSFDSLLQKAPLKQSDWLETGFHPFPLECLASIIKHGLLESSPDRPGCLFTERGLYLTNQRTHSAASYSHFVAYSAGVFCWLTME